MYGDLAEKLINEARRAQALEYLPLYNTELVRAITRESKELAELENRVLVTGLPDQTQDAVAGVYSLIQRRNKRCLIAYHHHRLRKIEARLWAEKEITEMASLSPHEQQYVRQFSELLVHVKDSWEEIDLTGAMDPPTDIYVEVRCLQDAGEIQTEYGVFDLSKNSQFYVKRSDVQRLIQQGLVELIQRK